MTDASVIKRTPAMFLQVVVVLVGIGILAFLLIEPRFEGVNANAAGFADIYLDDPFLAYVYASSILFFVALYQAFALLGNIGRNTLFSPQSLRSVRIIRYCATGLVALIAGAGAWIVVANGGRDDIAGGAAMCIFTMTVSAIVVAAAMVVEKPLRTAVELKSENELTV